MSELKKVVVIGPESTGKSTLSGMLAEHFDTVWVPEFARMYLEQLHRRYVEEDLPVIAKGQLQAEDRIAALVNNTLLVCDTDLQVIKVWSNARYGRCSRWILEQIAERKYDLYLLTNIDLEWQDDPLREHPLPEERRYFYHLYRDIVQNSGLPWVDISGNYEDRFKKAVAAIQSYILS